MSEHHEHEHEHEHAECCHAHEHHHEHEHEHAECCHEHEHEHEHGECCHEHGHEHERCCEHGECHRHEHEDACGCGHHHGHGDACGCGHEHGGHGEGENRTMVIRLIAGAVLFAGGLVAHFCKAPLYVELPLFLACWAVVSYDVVWNAIRGILRGNVFGEAFLMTIASIGAFVLCEFPEGAAVMLLYQLGEFLTDLALDRSQDSIRAILDIRPDTANVVRGGETLSVSPADVAIGETILVRPGDRIPLDGVILSGSSALDTRALTGESVPRTAHEGDTVLSGCIALDGVLTVRVEKSFGESTASRIIELVEEATDRKTPAERFITKFARYYTPAVVIAAVLLAVVPSLITGNWGDWIHRALTFLVISCPCALVISIPLAVFGGLGAASRAGVLIKGGNFLEALNRVHTVVFDKTGTLTEGSFAVREVLPADGFTKDEILRLAAGAESFSTHPIAKSIVAAAQAPEADVSDAHAIHGMGVTANVGGRAVAVGNRKLLDSLGLSVPEPETAGTVAFVAIDGAYAGCIVIADALKPDSREAVESLRTLGVSRQIMLTGDAKAVGDAVAKELQLDGVSSELLPDQKLEAVEDLYQSMPKGGTLVFVGDGINDAPVLARADVGVAMGGLGSDAAIEAADAVIMADAPNKLCDAIRISKKAHRITVENIVFALGMKAIFLALGALGLASLWVAVFGDVGVMLLAVLNALRTLKKPRKTA
ncbi:MAG: cadmium-translocating P-type ATPase [Clostridia bacterium]|nr:cadmium-translocating P-type ATPase [Clostridia bacterium]